MLSFSRCIVTGDYLKGQLLPERQKLCGIRFVTPAQRHGGLDAAILVQRKNVYEAARARTPHRWSGPTRNWERVAEVHLNPDRANSKPGKPNEEAETMRKAA